MIWWLLLCWFTISGGVGLEDKIVAISGTWMDHPNPPHPYASNMWWRLTNHTAQINDHSDCYVCAHFPHSTSGGDWYAHQDFDHALNTIMTVTVAAAGMPENHTVWIMLEGKKSCWSEIETVRRVAGRVATSKTMPNNMTCFQSDKGTEHLGKIPSSRCSKIYVSNSSNQTTRRECLLCLSKLIDHGGHLKQSDIALHFLKTTKKDRDRCKTACATVHIPDDEGTGVVRDVYWLCGYAIYVSLPRYWNGMCAPIQLHGGAIIIPVRQRNLETRFKRGLKDLFITGPVPANQRLWSTAEKVVSSIFPAVGVASLMKEVEVTRYALITFLQTTTVMLKTFSEKLNALRLMAIQNRIVLDQLTASQGGVCVVIAQSSCCTYVPRNPEDGHLIEEGINNLTLLAKTLTDWRSNTSGTFITPDFSAVTFGWEWLKGLFTSWKHAIVMGGCVLMGILLVLCFGPCLLRCIRKVIQRQTAKGINEMKQLDLSNLPIKPQQHASEVGFETASSSEYIYDDVSSFEGSYQNQ